MQQKAVLMSCLDRQRHFLLHEERCGILLSCFIKKRIRQPHTFIRQKMKHSEWRPKWLPFSCPQKKWSVFKAAQMQLNFSIIARASPNLGNPLLGLEMIQKIVP